MKDFYQLKKNLKQDFSGLKGVKTAVLGDTSTQFLSQVLRAEGYERGLDLQIWEADFNQVERQVYDSCSELYQFDPEVIVFFFASHKLLGKYNKLEPDACSSLSETELRSIRNINLQIKNNSKARVIWYNYTEIDDSVFGSYATKMESSFLFQLRKLNYQLMQEAANDPDFFLCDVSSIQNESGKAILFHSSIYINTEMVFSLDVLPRVASRTLDIICAFYGKIRKCVVLDLDNTLWGGVIGDDGIENIQIGSLGVGKAFSEFQQWLKKLKNRGIILAVCSKNSDQAAKEPFEKHPEMVLRLSDIAVFVANWENKADNIRQIQGILNIGFDTMVFLDDNPFERNLVRENLPEVCVPELPEDPGEYLQFLYSLNLFETVSHSQEDAGRTRLYQVEAERKAQLARFTNEDDFLQSLQMVSLVETFNAFNIPRVAQLSQRSNQFNLRTVRFTPADLEKLSCSTDVFTRAFSLKDKFGDNGLVCVLILEKESDDVLFISSWFMSCRVLKRGMEDFVLNTVVDLARQSGFSVLKGQYLPTSKNAMVKDHYRNLGFEGNGEFWQLDLNQYKPKKNYITLKQTEPCEEMKY